MYISAWAFCVARSLEWACEGLRIRMSKSMIPTLFVMIHIGQEIEHTLKEQGRTVTWFADQLCCTRPNVYKIFKKDNIDLKLLGRISDILGVDFFRLYSHGRFANRNGLSEPVSDI